MVLSAFARIQVRAPSLRQDHMYNARHELNYLLVQLGNLQPNLWKVQQNSIALVSGTATYTIPANTVMILDAWVSVNSGTPQQTDRYISPISRTEYASFANKATSGQSSQYWFDRLIAPTITMYPVPDSNGPYILNYFSCVQMQDANLPGGETMDVPYLWYDAIIAGMAHRLSRIYAPTLEAIRKADAQEAWKIAAEQNVENVPLSIAPTISTYYRR